MNPGDQESGYRASRLFPHHGFPVASGATPDLSHDVNREFERESVEYSVVRPFPPDEVISMYNRRFRDMGLVPDPEEGYPMRRWESIDPDSRTWRRSTTPPARYVAAWADERRTVRTLLILRYEKKPGDPLWRERLHVHVSHQKLFRLRDILPWR